MHFCCAAAVPQKSYSHNMCRASGVHGVAAADSGGAQPAAIAAQQPHHAAPAVRRRLGELPCCSLARQFLHALRHVRWQSRLPCFLRLNQAFSALCGPVCRGKPVTFRYTQRRSSSSVSASAACTSSTPANQSTSLVRGCCLYGLNSYHVKSHCLGQRKSAAAWDTTGLPHIVFFSCH